MGRSVEQVQHHYTVERKLASRLKNASSDQRLDLYSTVYNELYNSVPDHPMLLQSEQQSMLRQQAVQRKLKMLQPYLRHAKTFLEIGAGDCAMSLAVAKIVHHVVAVEVSDSITKGVDLPANVSVVIIDKPAAIPVDAQSVDLAFSDQLAEHLHPDDLIEQCRNVFNALAEGGNYVLVTPNGLNGPHDISRGFDETATGMHLKEYTFTELSNLLLSIGFKRVQPIVGFKGYYVRLPAKVILGLEQGLGLVPERFAKWIANTLPMQMLLAIRLVATR